jgi:hypothetical protein
MPPDEEGEASGTVGWGESGGNGIADTKKDFITPTDARMPGALLSSMNPLCLAL